MQDNMNAKACVIVIPIHNSLPSAYELISFEQCFKILSKYPIKIVAPKGLDLKEYQKAIARFDVINIEPKWQSSLTAYNKLKISRFFYQLFKDYEYLLTYELDAFVFRDELSFWCGEGYDYVGAPWFDDYLNTDYQKKSQLFKVGNSGFSLRNIRSAQNVLENFYYQMSWELKSGKENYLKTVLKTPFRWLKNQGVENYTLQKFYDLPEDQFFSETVPSKYKHFKIAPVEKAMKFSFEVRPEYLFQLNNNQLPMGCHAWWRYNLHFWKPFIESYGYDLDTKTKVV